MSTPHNLITDVAGIRVGNAHDPRLASGVTAIVFDRRNVASGVTRGGAPGTRDTALLEPEMTVTSIDAVLLGGGSLFGLDAAGGAAGYLRQQGRGLKLGGANIPVAVQAIIFDLNNGGDKDWGRMPPYWELGWQATETASVEPFALGTVGGGYGATTATFKGGLGSTSATTASGFKVGAIAVVNAIGSTVVGRGPHFWAAPWEVGTEFGGLGQPAKIPADALELHMKGRVQFVHHHRPRRHRCRPHQGGGEAAGDHGRRWNCPRHPPRPRAHGRRHRVCRGDAREAAGRARLSPHRDRPCRRRLPGPRHRPWRLRGDCPALPRRHCRRGGTALPARDRAMSRGRMLVAGVLAAALLVLLGWQLHRERMVKACLSAGGAWDGAACGPLRLRPILRRELERS